MFTVYRKPIKKEVVQGSHLVNQNSILDWFTILWRRTTRLFYSDFEQPYCAYL